MKWCRGCNKVLADARCPTCGELGINTQIIHRSGVDSSQRRRISTITEEDPNNDDLTRANEDA